MNDLIKLRELTERLPYIGIKRADDEIRVLIIEREKSINKLVLDTLEYFGCKCSSAQNSIEAIRLIEVNNYDVLLANISLKENGEDLKVVSKFQEKLPESVVVIMSSDEDKLSKYSRYFSTLAMPFGIYDLIKKVNEGITKRNN